MKPYTPKEGSVPARAIAFMALYPQKELTTKEVADFVAIKPQNLMSNLEAALKHGLLQRRTSTATGSALWRLGKGAETVDLGDADDKPDGFPRQTIVRAVDVPIVKTGRSSVFDTGASLPPPPSAALSKPKPHVKPVAISGPVQRAAPAEPPLSYAVFNTGELLIEVRGQPPLRLTAGQRADLVDYLQRFQTAATAA